MNYNKLLDSVIGYMKIIAVDKTMNGYEKKAWVLSQIELDLKLDPKIEQIIICMIDLLIDVDKGKIKINKKVKKICCFNI
jgi:hypothetical protein